MNNIGPSGLMTVLSAGELRNGEVIIRIGNDYITGVIEDISIRVCSSGFPKFEISGFVLNPE